MTGFLGGRPSRRDLLRSGTALAMAGAWSGPRRAQELRVAVVGLNGIGREHVAAYQRLDGVRVTALCDVDEAVLASALALLESGAQVAQFADFRRVLERKDVDAVSLATPDHWHALQAIWACQAGKDVYLESPLTHTLEEGRRLVQAARKYGRLVQPGLTSRSHLALDRAIDWLRTGALGEVRLGRAICYTAQPSIGKVGKPRSVPPTLDFELWTGPAPLAPLARSRVHQDWRYSFETGGGMLADRGVQALDLARRALGEQGLPRGVSCLGGRFGYDDDGRTPNTAVALFDYPSAPLVCELRGLPRDANEQAGAWRMADFDGLLEGARIECEGGTLTLHVSGLAVAADSAGKEVARWRSCGDPYARFVQALHEREATPSLEALESGRVSAALAQLANVSLRLGSTEPATSEASARALFVRDELTEVRERLARHLEANRIAPDSALPIVGPWLPLDPGTGGLVAKEARAYETRAYREPFTLPEPL